MLVAASAAFALVTTSVPAGAEATSSATEERKGVRIEAKVEGVVADESGNHPLIEKQFSRVTLKITDSSTGRPISGLYPGGWMDRLPSEKVAAQETCADKVSSFLGGGLFGAAAVTLNRFFVLVLNGDGTVSVVDPQFEFGGSRLLALVQSSSPAMDWAVNASGRRLWLAIPEEQRILEVDTFSWKPIRDYPLSITPTRILIQPGSDRLWAVGDAADGTGAAVVVDTGSASVAQQITIGAGPHEFAFESDGRYAIVTSFRAGSVTVVDAVGLRVSRVEAVAGAPVSLSWSDPANLAAVSDRLGAVYLVDPEGRRPTTTVTMPQGIGRIEAAPEVPFAVVLEPTHQRFHVVDLATGTVAQTTDVLGTPDEVSFSAGLVYVHHADTEKMFAFPIPSLGNGSAISPVTIPSGQRAPGTVIRGGSVRTVVKVFGENSMLVAAPADRSVYYYREGMAAPMGSFKNYGKTPVGVRVIDRSFREQGPGEYETVAELGPAGRYDLVLLLDSPSVVQCFPFEVLPDRSASEGDTVRPLDLAWHEEPAGLTPGKPSRLQVTLRDAVTGDPVGGLTDLGARVTLPARWQRHLAVTPVGDEQLGRYELSFTAPEEGTYIFFFSSSSAGIRGERTLSLFLRVSGSDVRAKAGALAQQEQP